MDEIRLLHGDAAPHNVEDIQHAALQQTTTTLLNGGIQEGICASEAESHIAEPYQGFHAIKLREMADPGGLTTNMQDLMGKRIMESNMNDTQIILVP